MRMRFVFWLLCILTTVASAFAESALVMSPADHIDLGPVFTFDIGTTVSVVVHNTSNEDVTIQKAKSTCACMVPAGIFPVVLTAHASLNLPIHLSYATKTNTKFSHRVYLFDTTDQALCDVTIDAQLYEPVALPSQVVITKERNLVGSQTVFVRPERRFSSMITLLDVSMSTETIRARVIPSLTGAESFLEVSASDALPVGWHYAQLDLDYLLEGRGSHRSSSQVAVHVLSTVTDDTNAVPRDDSHNTSGTYSYEYVIANRVYRQGNCGPVCLCLLLSHFGKKANIAEVPKELERGPKGVSMLELKRVAHLHGLRLEGVKISQAEDLDAGYLPCIAIGKDLDHFFYVFRRIGDNMVYFDPADDESRIVVKPTDQMQEVWGGYVLFAP